MARVSLLILALQGLVLVAPSSSPAQSDWRKAAARMVDEAVAAGGVKDTRVLEAARSTPRHEFMPGAQRKHAYLDMALPIGSGQTISPPFVVAYMTEQILPQPEDRVLEIGTGSGYQAAILSPLVKEVYSIEIVEALGRRAAQTLKRLKYDNVFTKVGDGYQGWPEHAPFDKIIVTCSPENVPQPLVDQLRDGGRMIIPLGERYQQTLYVFTKREGQLESEALLPTLFVPMTGAAEEARAVQPDPLNPTIRNGSFEEAVGETRQPLGWHYQRQLTWVRSNEAPEGQYYASFENTIAGQACQALQGFAIDGRSVPEIELSAWIMLSEVREGQQPGDLPMVAITFFDERRGMIGEAILGPWRGSAEWQQVRKKFPVPPRAREGIVRIGLLGATGKVLVDGVTVRGSGAAPNSR